MELKYFTKALIIITLNIPIWAVAFHFAFIAEEGVMFLNSIEWYFSKIPFLGKLFKSNTPTTNLNFGSSLFFIAINYLVFCSWIAVLIKLLKIKKEG